MYNFHIVSKKLSEKFPVEISQNFLNKQKKKTCAKGIKKLFFTNQEILF